MGTGSLKFIDFGLACRMTAKNGQTDDPSLTGDYKTPSPTFHISCEHLQTLLPDHLVSLHPREVLLETDLQYFAVDMFALPARYWFCFC